MAFVDEPLKYSRSPKSSRQSALKNFILKATWADVSRLAEYKIIEQALATDHPDVVNHLPFVLGYRDDDMFATHHIRTALAATPPSAGHRVLRLIAFEELYRVQDQISSKAVMSLVLQAVRCHYALWVRNMHHTDISLDNVMVRKRFVPDDDAPRLFGVVNDWDLASTSQSFHAQLERTGTVPYMHPELLTDAYWEGKIPRLYRHDNASFIWVMVFLFLRYHEGKVISTTPTLPLDDLMTSNYKTARLIKKDIVNKLTEFSCAPDAKEEWQVVVELLLWTTDDGRDLARLRAQNDPVKLAALLNTDDASDVYKAFWSVVQDQANRSGMEYILDFIHPSLTS